MLDPDVGIESFRHHAPHLDLPRPPRPQTFHNPIGGRYTAGQLDTLGNDQIHLSSHSRAIWSAQRSRRPRSPSENASLCWLSTSMRPITRSPPGPNTGTTISERVLPSVVR